MTSFKKPVFLPLSFFFLTILAWPSASSSQEWTVEGRVHEETLENGLTVLIAENPEMDRVRCIIAYRVGSVNERPGITGISHFLEHMMFKGTQTRGVKPGMLDRDLEIQGELDRLWAMIQDEGVSDGPDQQDVSNLRLEFDRLLEEQRETVIDENAILDAYKAAGGSGANAMTGKEKTQFYVTLPKESVGLFLEIEADRMENAILRGFYSEREVVLEERRMGENRARVLFNEQVEAAFYAASPYQWPVSGWSSDLREITRQDMEEYRELYYRPENATVVLVGGLEAEEGFALARKYFGKIPSKGPSPRIPTREPTLKYYKDLHGPDFSMPRVEKRLVGSAPGIPTVQLRFHTPPIWHRDIAPLTVLSVLFMLPPGDLHRTLVQESRKVDRISANLSNLMYDGSFTIRADLREEERVTVASPAEVEETLWAFIERAKTEPVDPELLLAVKNQMEASVIKAYRGSGLASPLAEIETIHEWEYLDELQRRILSVTEDDLMRVARMYLSKDNSLVSILEREG